jgi:nucleoid-associated protein YgaU
MKVAKIVLYLIVIAFLTFSSTVFAQSYNYKEMKMDEYNALLQEWQGRLKAAQDAITQEDQRLETAKKCNDDIQAQIDATWGEIYAAVNSSKEGDQAYKKQVAQLRSDVSAFLSLSPEEIYRRKDELKTFKVKLAELRANDLGLLSDNLAALDAVESMIKQAEEKGKPAVPDTYSVVRGDFLWRIAGMKEMYGDPYAWMRIYTSNKDLIKNPDLIYPAQVFRIPRDVGPNEYLVARGDFLAKIAGLSNVYGSTFKWQKLYEANKDLIEDPNLIYPYQVLQVPKN